MGDGDVADRPLAESGRRRNAAGGSGGWPFEAPDLHVAHHRQQPPGRHSAPCGREALGCGSNRGTSSAGSMQRRARRPGRAWTPREYGYCVQRRAATGGAGFFVDGRCERHVRGIRHWIICPASRAVHHGIGLENLAIRGLHAGRTATRDRFHDARVSWNTVTVRSRSAEHGTNIDDGIEPSHVAMVSDRSSPVWAGSIRFQLQQLLSAYSAARPTLAGVRSLFPEPGRSAGASHSTQPPPCHHGVPPNSSARAAWYMPARFSS